MEGGGMAGLTYEPRVLKHPEYARAFHHYLGRGAPPDDAARLAYTWARKKADRRRNAIAVTALSVTVGLCMLCGVGALLAPDEPDTAAPTAARETTPSPDPTSEAPSPSPTIQTPSPPRTEAPSPPAATSVAPDRPAPTTRAPAPRKAPVPAPTTRKPRPPAPPPPPRNCEPSYPDVCLRTGIGDYDCESGTGNGPNYVAGPLRVRSPDPFGLDADNDGIGCERG